MTRPVVAADPERRLPGRPRSARADEAIIDAALELIADGVTLEALSIEAVAARAGVGKATIYRRWPNKEALVVDAVASLKPPLPALAGACVRDDLIALLSRMGQRHDRPGTSVMYCLLPELARNERLQECYHAVVEPRRDVMREVLRRGVRSGELRADLDVELTLTLLSSPVLVQGLGWNPHLDPTDLAARVVDTVLGGIAAPGERP
jgi:AcrR family transcriptional regulator